MVKKIKMQESHLNNLLQMADYICSIISRKIQKKSDTIDYRKFISSKEVYIQVWPK